MPRSLTHVLTALAAASLLAAAPACRPGGDTSDPSAATPSLDPPVVIEWFLGQFRAPTTSNRRIHLGILTRPVKAAPSQASDPHPNSCAPGLVSFIPTPTANVWLATDDTGTLFRYAGNGWSPVPVPGDLPPVGKLLALAVPPDHPDQLELLVTLHDDSQLSVLVLVDDTVTAQHPPESAQLSDRRAALQRFDSGRCLGDARDCLHVTPIDDGFMVTREPTLNRDRVEIPLPPGAHVQDVRYTDDAGTTLALLTQDACPKENTPPADPSTESSTEPSAADPSPQPAPAR
jgi:hypothetical protein